jgi:hypothetical protein
MLKQELSVSLQMLISSANKNDASFGIELVKLKQSVFFVL